MFSSDILAEETAFTETLALQSSLFQVSDAHTAVSQFGITATAMLLLGTAGLITIPVSRDQAALESLTADADLALESLLTSFKEKVASWAGKVLALVKDTGKAVIEKIKSLGAKIAAALGDSKDAAVAQGKDLEAKVKAHPYKTVLAALAAAGAVVGVVAFAAGNLGAVLTASKVPWLLKTLAGMIGKIAWPFGKIMPQVVKDHKLLVTVVAVPTVTAAAGIATLGWANQSSSVLAEKIRHVVDSVGRAWDKVKEKATPIVTTGATMAKGIGSGTIAGAKAGFGAASKNPTVKYHSAGTGEHALGGTLLSGLFGLTGAVIVGGSAVLVSVLHILFHLIRVIVFGALNMVSSGVTAIKGAKASDAPNDYV